jgi:hypothetical protein
VTIFVYGDPVEAAKYRSTVEHYLNEMTRTFGKTSQSYWRQISDTAKVHLRLINGQPFAYLYVDEVLQGFVIGLQNSSILPEGFETWTLATLLQDVENIWSKKKQPYHFGNKPIPSALPYSINLSNAVIFTYKNIIYKVIKAWIPPNETPSTYLDGEPLYLDDNTLFLHRDKTVVPVINSLVDTVGWQSHDELKYEWTDASLVADLHLGMLVALWRYDSPPIVKHVGNTLEFYFLMMNETIAFTVQRYQATLSASSNSPYLTLSTPTSLVNEWALGEFIQTAGRSYTSGGNPETPIGGLDPNGLCVWHKAGPDTLWSVTGFAGSGCYATSPNYSNYTYSASGHDESTITLNSGLEFEVKREMSASATGGAGTTLFYGTNDTGETIWLGNLNITDRTHGYIPTSSNWEGTAHGDPIGDVGAIEDGELLTGNNETASTSITCKQLPFDLQKTTHSGSRSGQFIESWRYNKTYPDQSTDVNWGGDYRMTLYTYSPYSSITPLTLSNVSHVFDTTVAARDYIYCDLEEQVFIYIELDATGNYINGVGSSEVAIRFCLDYRGHVFKQNIYSYTMDASIFVNVKNPDDVNFGTAAMEVRFTVPNPYMPKLIFAPKWTTQSQCPYIAYRALAEIGTLDNKGNPIPDEMLFTMRFQLYRERRALDDSPILPTEAVVPPEGTVTLKVPLIEHTARTHGFQVKSLFDNLELLWPTVSFSIPASTDWLADVLPTDWPRPISDDDEPTTGTFTKNSGDLSTWNIYRT